MALLMHSCGPPALLFPPTMYLLCWACFHLHRFQHNIIISSWCHWVQLFSPHSSVAGRDFTSTPDNLSSALCLARNLNLNWLNSVPPKHTERPPEICFSLLSKLFIVTEMLLFVWLLRGHCKLMTGVVSVPHQVKQYIQYIYTDYILLWSYILVYIYRGPCSIPLSFNITLQTSG